MLGKKCWNGCGEIDYDSCGYDPLLVPVMEDLVGVWNISCI